jgi:hypothetical protein
VCFLTGYDLNDLNTANYRELPENKTKIVIKPVYLTQFLEIIRTLLDDNSSEAEIKH